MSLSGPRGRVVVQVRDQLAGVPRAADPLTAFAADHARRAAALGVDPRTAAEAVLAAWAPDG